VLRRRVAARRLSETKAWISSVARGAPHGREAIQRSASSRAGERSTSPSECPATDPPARGFAELGVLPDPSDVGLQRLDQLIDARLEMSWFVEKDRPRVLSQTE
jgi:hypothetical protein